MRPIWDSSTNEFFYWNADFKGINKNGKAFVQVHYVVKIEGCLLQVNLDLSADQLDTKGDEFKQIIIGTANLASRFITESKPGIVSVSYTNHLVSTCISHWENENTSSSVQEVSELNGRIDSFSARVFLDPKNIDKIASIYNQTIHEPVLRKDIATLLSILPYEDMTEQLVKDCIDSFQKILNPITRASILEGIRKAYMWRGHKEDWILCIPLSIDANSQLADDKEADMKSWKPILDHAGSYEELAKELTNRKIDINVKDYYSDSLLTTSLSREEYIGFAKAAIKSGNVKNINLRNSRNDTALNLACEQGDIDIVNDLLAIEEIDVNNHGFLGYTPLSKAIREKHAAVVEALVKTGRINDVNDERGAGNGETFLTFACQTGSTAIVKALLTLPEIDVNCPNFHKKTPLFYAISEGHVEIVKALLEMSGIDVNKSDKIESFPLLCALFRDDHAIFKELVKRPEINVSILFQYLEQHPGLCLHKNIAVLEECLPELTQTWFAAHTEARIARLINEEKYDQAKKELEDCFQSDKPFNIVSFTRMGEKIFSFIIENHYEIFSKWLVKNNILESLSLEDQCDILENLDVFFYQYITSSKARIGEGIYRVFERTLGPKGIAIIIDYLRKKKSPSLPQEDRVSLCHDYVTFDKELKKLVENPDIKDGYSHYFIVSECEENPHFYGTHVTPLYFKKISGKWIVVITDSTTEYKNRETHCGPLVKRIEKIEKEFPDDFKVKTIHVNTFWRQVDDSSCPIYAIRDLVYFYRYGDEFLKTLSSEDQKINYFNDLPPELMKTNQSVREIKEYEKERRFKGQRITMATRKSKTPGTETILENLKRHSREESKNEVRNYLANDRTKKYQKIIINEFITAFRSLFSS